MRGIIFDLDDTLYRRIDYLRSGFDAVSRYLAHSWRCDADTAFAALMGAHAACAGREFQTVCAELRLPASLVPALVTIFRAHEPALTLPTSVRRMLERIRAAGWRLGVLTNGDPGVQRRKVAALGLEPFVDAVVYAEACAPGGKPHPYAFAAVADALSLDPARCVFVGDDPVRDIAGAKRAGMHAIQVNGCARDISWEADVLVAVVTDAMPLAELLLTEAADAA